MAIAIGINGKEGSPARVEQGAFPMIPQKINGPEDLLKRVPLYQEGVGIPEDAEYRVLPSTRRELEAYRIRRAKLGVSSGNNRLIPLAEQVRGLPGSRYLHHDVYNITPPFPDGDNELLAARVEAKHINYSSEVLFFKRDQDICTLESPRLCT